MNDNWNRRGELTSSQLITIIILIVSFAVILIFFWMFNFKGEISKESCRNSVVLRGTALTKQAVSLQCSTQDVCLSMTNSCVGAKKDTTVLKVVDKPALMNELSNLMYDCWWQMGNGKIDYRSSGIGNEESYCAVCNTVKIDDSIKNNKDLNGISLAELFSYMQTKSVPNSNQSYLQYLYGMNNLDEVNSNLKAISTRYGTQIDITSQKIDLNSGDLALVTALTKDGWGMPLAGGAAGGVAGGALGYFVTASAFGGPISWVVGGAAVAGAATVGTIAYASSDNGLKYLPPTYYSYNGESFRALNCKEFSTLS